MKHFWTLTIPSALMVLATVVQGQDAPKLNARELFYSPPPSPSGNNSNTGASNGASGKSGSGPVATGTAGTGTGTTSPTTPSLGAQASTAATKVKVT